MDKLKMYWKDIAIVILIITNIMIINDIATIKRQVNSIDNSVFGLQMKLDDIFYIVRRLSF